MTTRKLKLEIDALAVETFDAGRVSELSRGTVQGHDDATFCKCNTDSCEAFDTDGLNNCSYPCGCTYLCETSPTTSRPQG
jgi:hypothetical protein